MGVSGGNSETKMVCDTGVIVYKNRDGEASKRGDVKKPSDALRHVCGVTKGYLVLGYTSAAEGKVMSINSKGKLCDDKNIFKEIRDGVATPVCS
jgi:hypothetical protein